MRRLWAMCTAAVVSAMCWASYAPAPAVAAATRPCSSAGLRTTRLKDFNCILGVPSPLPGLSVGPGQYCAPPYSMCEDYNDAMGSPQATSSLIVNFVPVSRTKGNVLDVTEQMQVQADAAFLDLSGDASIVAASDFMVKSYQPLKGGATTRFAKARGPLPAGTVEILGRERCAASCGTSPRVGYYAAAAWYWKPYEFDVSVDARTAAGAERALSRIAEGIWLRSRAA